MKPLRILLRAVIDYAGLFPPAGLDMGRAVSNYRDYLKSEHRWALGRFIVPVSRLGEFEEAAAPILGSELEPWRLSALVGQDSAGDLDAIAAFNDRATGAVIDTVEVKADTAERVNEVTRLLPESLDGFFELAGSGDPAPLVHAIAAVGRRAKIRTGGVTEDLIPSVRDVAAFIDACRREDVAFKATAGLHHPLRGDYRLTYEPDSGSATMHGFLNVFLAACFRHAGASREEIEEILSTSDGSEFEVGESDVRWREHRLPAEGIETARRRFAVSFGSCSFEEPIDELRGMHLL